MRHTVKTVVQNLRPADRIVGRYAADLGAVIAQTIREDGTVTVRTTSRVLSYPSPLSKVTVNRERPNDVVLACLASGEHVQVGGVMSHDGAHTLFDVLDSDLTGYYRERGALKFDASRANAHRIDGEPVKFYRVRQFGHEFGNVRQFGLNRLARRAG